jgi:hypothetical protein
LGNLQKQKSAIIHCYRATYSMVRSNRRGVVVVDPEGVWALTWWAEEEKKEERERAQGRAGYIRIWAVG